MYFTTIHIKFIKKNISQGEMGRGINWEIGIDMYTQCCCCVSSSVVSDSMDGSPPGSSVHGILQARILEWVATPSSRASSQSTDGNPGLLHCRQSLYHLSHQGNPIYTLLYIK